MTKIEHLNQIIEILNSTVYTEFKNLYQKYKLYNNIMFHQNWANLIHNRVQVLNDVHHETTGFTSNELQTGFTLDVLKYV